MQPQWNKIDKSVFRILDANVNRACEGLRVMEDLFRFVLNDEKHSRVCKKIRHEIRNLFPETMLIRGRDSGHDVGQSVIQYGAEKRNNFIEIARANAKRAQEAMRVVEEAMKLPAFQTDVKDLQSRENARYEVYTLEKVLTEGLAKA